ncbi:MAG: M48 family metallopeptidase [Chloroflexi bacterium]|nr:M48 family metallopeptidase [Chloroflexota bacterium]
MAEAPHERILIYDRIDANKRSTLVIMAGFVLLAAGVFTSIGVIVSYYAGVQDSELLETSIRVGIAAAILASAIAVMMYFLAPTAVLTISGAHEVTKEEEPELYRVVENLSIGSGLLMPKVWVIEDGAPNALATGRDVDRAHVAVTRGLLDKLEKRELEAVMAHEMSHIGNLDIRLMTIVAVVVGIAALIADIMLRFTWYGAGARRSNRGKGGGGIGVILLVIAIVFLLISPIIAGIMRMALSRRREYLADSSGALLCRNPAALADALEKIAKDPDPLEAANKATAHLYIAAPLQGHESFMNKLFATHPPVEERVRLLRAMA